MSQQRPHRRAAAWLAVASLITGGAAIGLRRLRQWRTRRNTPAPFVLPTGLSDAEAEARYQRGQGRASQRGLVRTWRNIRRESVFSVFHVNLIGLSLVQMLLREWLSAVITLVMLGVSIGIRLLQERLAVRRMVSFLGAASIRYTVVREGRACSVPPERVVPGDLLLVGPGDQFLADGTLQGRAGVMVDTYHANGVRGTRRVRPGGKVYGGSFCVSGRGSYTAERLGPDTYMSRRHAGETVSVARMTPLERVVSRILRVLLIVVVVYAVLYLLALNRLDIGAPAELFVDAAPVIFNLAPSGLYLMIIISYISGAADLVKRGGLVTRARSVESLAETTVVCFTEVGILAGTSMEMSIIRHPGEAHLSEPRIRQLLGDAARSTTSTTALMRALSDSFEGERRPVRAEAPFLATLGWTAIIFADPDIEGVYVLGDRDAVEEHLTIPLSPEEETGSQVMVVAYRPDPVSLVDARGRPRLPDDLVPLATLRLRHQLGGEAMAVLQGLLEAGVSVKAFAASSATESLDRLRDLGLAAADVEFVRSRGLISRAELEQQPRTEWGRIARENALFGGLTPTQVGDLVRAMREEGEFVTVVGDGVTDLPALSEANLAVAQPGSTQAALVLADIYLLDNSPRALLGMLNRGQTIVQGLLNVIKLDLAMVVATAMLIVAVRLFSVGFPYGSSHESALGIIAVTIPSLALSLWSQAGPVASRGYGWTIARFILPVGLALSIAAFAVYWHFFESTGRVAYAQQAVAYLLIYSGLIVGLMTLRTRRMAILVVVLAAVTTLLPLVPLARWQFRLDWLAQPWDYVILVLAVAGWLVLVTLLWRLLPTTGTGWHGLGNAMISPRTESGGDVPSGRSTPTSRLGKRSPQRK